MVDWKLSPEEILEDLINKNVKLQIVEYLSAALAIGGTVATAVTSQAVYAAAPLTLSVVLNLFNRRQLDQLTRQHTFADTTEIQRRLSADIQALRTQVHDLPVTTEQRDFSEIQATLASLSEKIGTLEPQVQNLAIAPTTEGLESLETELAQLRDRQQDFADALASINKQSHAVAAGSPSPELAQDVADLKAAIAQLEQRQSSSVSPELAQEVSALKAAITQLEQRQPTYISGDAEGVNLEPLQAEIQALWTPIRRKISSFSAGLEALPAQAEQIEQIQGQVAGLNTRLDESLAQVSTEISGFHSTVANTQGEVQRVQNQLTDIQQRIAHVVSTDQLDGMNQEIRSTLTPLQTQIVTLQEQLDNRPVFDPAVTQAQSEQLQSVQSQLESLNTQIEQIRSGQASTAEEIRSSITPLQEQLAALQEQLNSRPVFDPSVAHAQSEHLQSLQSQLEEVRTRIDHVSGQVDHVSGQVSNVEEVRSSITPLQEQLAALQEQLNSRPVFDPSVAHAQSEHLQSLQSQLEEVRTRIDHVSGQVDHVSGQVSNAEEVRSSITPLQEQLAALQEQLNSRPVFDPSVAHAQSEHLQSLQSQLEAIGTRIDHVSGQVSNAEEIRSAITPLQEQLAALQEQLNSRPVFDPSVTHTQSEQLQNVQSQLAALGTRIDQISGQSSAPDEMSGSITSLQEQLATLKDQLQHQPTFDPAVSQAQAQQLQSLQNELSALKARLDQISTQVSSEIANIPTLVDTKVHSQMDQLQHSKAKGGQANNEADLDAILANL